MKARFIGALAVWSGVLGTALPLGVLSGGCGGEETSAIPPMVPSPMPEPPPPPLQPAAHVPEAPAPMKPVMAEAQRKFLSELEAALAARDAKKLAALYSTGAVLVTAGKEGVHQAVGRDEIEKGQARGFSVMGKAFPDIKWTHTRALQKGEVMTVEWTANGTDTGGFLDDKPTNKKIGFRGVSIYWFDDDGLVKREHNVVDPMTIMGQLGRGDVKSKVRPAEPVSTVATKWGVAKDSPEEQKNLDTARALYPLLEKKDEKAFLAMLTDDVVHSDLAQPEDVKGKDGAKKELGVWFKAFPDMRIEVTNAWAFGDVVVTELTSTGTFKGPLGPLRPNNKTATTHGIDVLEMKDGKIARVTSYANAREFLVQYELMPKPPVTSATGRSEPVLRP